MLKCTHTFCGERFSLDEIDPLTVWNRNTHENELELRCPWCSYYCTNDEVYELYEDYYEL